MSVILRQHQNPRERAAAEYQARLERALRGADAAMGTSDSKRWTLRGLLFCYVVSYLVGFALYLMDWLASLPPSALVRGGALQTRVVTRTSPSELLGTVAAYALEVLVLGALGTRLWSLRRRPWLGGSALLIALGLSVAAVGALALDDRAASRFGVGAVLACVAVLVWCARWAGTFAAAIALALFGVLCVGSSLAMSGVSSTLTHLLVLIVLPIGNALARWPAWVASRDIASELARNKLLQPRVVRALQRELKGTLLSMLGLCALVPALAWLAGAALDTPVPFELLVTRTLADPLGAALGVTLMLASTGLALLWHVVSLTRALASARSDGRARS